MTASITGPDDTPAPAGPTDLDGSLRAARPQRPHVDDEGYDIRIAPDGTWFYQGTPINRVGLVKLFASVLHRDAAGDHWLITPAERGRIRVDDAPFVAVGLERDGNGPDQILRFRTNLDHTVEAGPEQPIEVRYPTADTAATGAQAAAAPDDDTDPPPRPYIAMDRGLEALIARPIFYELVELADEHAGRLGVWSRGTFFPLDRQPATVTTSPG